MIRIVSLLLMVVFALLGVVVGTMTLTNISMVPFAMPFFLLVGAVTVILGISSTVVRSEWRIRPRELTPGKANALGFCLILCALCILSFFPQQELLSRKLFLAVLSLVLLIKGARYLE